jgi:hypothetical protein
MGEEKEEEGHEKRRKEKKDGDDPLVRKALCQAQDATFIFSLITATRAKQEAQEDRERD